MIQKGKGKGKGKEAKGKGKDDAKGKKGKGKDAVQNVEPGAGLDAGQQQLQPIVSHLQHLVLFAQLVDT